MGASKVPQFTFNIAARLPFYYKETLDVKQVLHAALKDLARPKEVLIEHPDLKSIRKLQALSKLKSRLIVCFFHLYQKYYSTLYQCL